MAINNVFMIRFAFRLVFQTFSFLTDVKRLHFWLDQVMVVNESSYLFIRSSYLSLFFCLVSSILFQIIVYHYIVFISTYNSNINNDLPVLADSGRFPNLIG